MNDARTTPKHALKQVAKAAGVPLKDLLVLATANDPFNCGGPQQIKQAEWFARIWSQLVSDPLHLRKFHYRLVSQREPPLKPDGTPYRNTEKDWNNLQTWSKYARYLRLVDPHQIVDNRNPNPHLFAPEPVRPESSYWSIESWFGFDLPYIATSLYSEFSLPTATVSGYEYRPGEQPYHVEIWAEKSTMDEDLIPICRQHGANLVTASGFQSVTGAIAALSRAEQYAALGRPVRIFYLSDFDPAGDTMPVAVSRQIEFWCEQYGNGVDIKLTPLALTKAQVVQYELPTIPIKETDKRKEAFEERHGVDGAVELDALEALYPDTLKQIVRDAIVAYRDEELTFELIDTAAEANELVTVTWQEHLHEYRVQAESLQRRAEDIAERFQPKLKKLAGEFDAEMQPIREEAEALEAKLEDVIDNTDLTIPLPVRPTACIELPDESDWLFAYDRDFLDQLEHYKAHKAGK